MKLDTARTRTDPRATGSLEGRYIVLAVSRRRRGKKLGQSAMSEKKW